MLRPESPRFDSRRFNPRSPPRAFADRPQCVMTCRSLSTGRSLPRTTLKGGKRPFKRAQLLIEPTRFQLTPKPRQGKIYARRHACDGNHPQPSAPKAFCPSLGNERGAQADDARAQRGGGGPAVPVHRRRKEAERGVGEIPRLDGPGEDDAERRKHGEQRELTSDRDRITRRERRPERECEPPQRSGGTHEPKPRILLRTWPIR